MKKLIIFCLLIICVINVFGCVGDSDCKHVTFNENGVMIYCELNYMPIGWFDNEYRIIESTLIFEEIKYDNGNKKEYDLLTFYEDGKNIVMKETGSIFYLKEGFELKDKYNATITTANIKDISREISLDISFSSNLTLNDILDKENKIESIPQELPYYFIDIRVEEYSYLCIYEVLRVYNGEVYINLTPSREDNTRYNYPIKQEYKNYFASIIDVNSNV